MSLIGLKLTSRHFRYVVAIERTNSGNDADIRRKTEVDPSRIWRAFVFLLYSA